VLGLSGLLAGGLLAACGGGTTTIHTSSGTIAVHSHGSHSTYSFQSSGAGGSVSESVAGSGTSVQLPSGFPSSVPLPHTGRLVLAVNQSSPSGSAGSSTGRSFELIYKYPTQSAGSAALTAYAAELTSAGFQRQGSFSGSGTENQGWTSSTWKVLIMLGPTGSSGAAELLITVSPATTTG